MISEIVTRFVLPWLALTLFLLVILRALLKRLFREIAKDEQDTDDERTWAGATHDQGHRAGPLGGHRGHPTSMTQCRYCR